MSFFDLCLYDGPSEWLMAYTTMNMFFDESGKFKDHRVITFGGVASYAEHMSSFARQWEILLTHNGITELSAKKVFNHRRPLSEKNKDLGVRSRVKALLPFIECIRKELLVVTGMAIDVNVFKALPSHMFHFFKNDPIFLAFARSILQVVDFTPANDKITFICDDDQQTAEHFLALYRRIKNVWPPAREKVHAICFAKDDFLFALQAADLVSSLFRLESGRRWYKDKYNYRPLFNALTKTPKQSERIQVCELGFGDKKQLTELAKSLKPEYERMQKLQNDPNKQ
jgi:hypothetical protein